MSAVTQPIYHLELIDGREIQKPLPKKLHFLIQNFLIVFLNRELPRCYLVGPEANILCGNDRIVPDITLMMRDAQFVDGDLGDPALLAIEILSPGQTVGDLFDKCDRILKAGTPLCWVIWPEKRRAWEYSANDLIEASSALKLSLPKVEGEPVCLEVPLAAMWAQLD